MTMISKKVYIYKVTSPSGRNYIGIAYNHKKRMIQHKSDKNGALYPVIQKYGLENLDWDVIYTAFSREHAEEMEIKFIQEYDSYSNGYNRTRGGEAGGGAKVLTEKDVEEIIHLLKTTTLTEKELGKKFNCNERAIRSIKSGRTWAWKTDGGVDRPLVSKMNHKRGSKLYNAKFTEEEVIVIKTRLRDGVSARSIARDFNVSPSTINAIKNGRNWDHVKVEGFVEGSNKNFANKLNEDIVRELKVDIESESFKAKDLMEKYKISKPTFYRIKNGELWKHIEV